MATLGLLLIFLELNRPGRVLPAGVGLLLLLLASATLFRLRLQPWPASLVIVMGMIAGLNLYRRLPSWLLVLTTAGWVVALRFLVRPQDSRCVHMPVALAAGGLLGVLSAVLTRIAYRARRAKALN